MFDKHLNFNYMMESNKFKYLLGIMEVMKNYYYSQDCDLNSMSKDDLVQQLCAKLRAKGYVIKDDVSLSNLDLPELIHVGETWPIEIEVINGSNIYAFNILLMKDESDASDFAEKVYRNMEIVNNAVNRPFCSTLIFTNVSLNLHHPNELLPEITEIIGLEQLPEDVNESLRDVHMAWGEDTDQGFRIGLNLQYNDMTIREDLTEYMGTEIVTMDEVMHHFILVRSC